jgi:hypothetical protein
MVKKAGLRKVKVGSRKVKVGSRKVKNMKGGVFENNQLCLMNKLADSSTLSAKVWNYLGYKYGPHDSVNVNPQFVCSDGKPLKQCTKCGQFENGVLTMYGSPC